MAELRCECLDVRDELRELLNAPAVFAGMLFRAAPADAEEAPSTGAPPDEPPPAQADMRPKYDAERRALMLDGVVLLSFRQPAKNQQALLVAFQEEGWPEYLYDPLPGSRVNAVKRLQDAVFALNGTLETEALRRAELSAGDCAAYTVEFHTDKSGERPRWQWTRITTPDAARRWPRAKLFVG